MEPLVNLNLVDLANHQTVLSIETRDQGIVYDDGSMELVGRIPNANPRGCSLSVEEVDRFFIQKEQKVSTYPHRPLNEHQNNQKIATVTEVLNTLLQWSPEQVNQIAEGLSKPNAHYGWSNAIRSILQGNWKQMESSSHKPQHITIVLVRVFLPQN